MEYHQQNAWVTGWLRWCLKQWVQTGVVNRDNCRRWQGKAIVSGSQGLSWGLLISRKALGGSWMGWDLGKGEGSPILRVDLSCKRVSCLVSDVLRRSHPGQDTDGCLCFQWPHSMNWHQWSPSSAGLGEYGGAPEARSSGSGSDYILTFSWCIAHPWVGKIPWSRKWQPSPVFLPGESQEEPGCLHTIHGITESDTSTHMKK